MSHTVDHWVSVIIEKVTKSIQLFVAVLFLLITLGMLYGVYAFQTNPWLFAVPPGLAALSYYNTDFALISLGLLLVVFLV
jgi:hypothetical protein